jgi:uncharacterized lipoprotein
MKISLLTFVAILMLSGCDDGSQNRPAKKPDSAENKTEPRTIKASDITALNKTLESFYIREGRFPTNLNELVERQYIPRLPLLPENTTWDYDTNSGIVGINKN